VIPQFFPAFLLPYILLVIVPSLVGSDVLTAVVMKSYVFWDITPCSPLKVNRCLEEHVALFSLINFLFSSFISVPCYILPSSWFSSEQMEITLFVPEHQHHNLKAYCAAEVKLHTFLTSELGGGELVTSRFVITSSDLTGFENVLSVSRITLCFYSLLILTTSRDNTSEVWEYTTTITAFRSV
jgi:hypothetical protein